MRRIFDRTEIPKLKLDLPLTVDTENSHLGDNFGPKSPLSPKSPPLVTSTILMGGTIKINEAPLEKEPEKIFGKGLKPQNLGLKENFVISPSKRVPPMKERKRKRRDSPKWEETSSIAMSIAPSMGSQD